MEKDPEELRKIFQKLKEKGGTDIPSFDELMNRPWKKIKVAVPFHRVAAALIIIIACGTLVYFMLHESQPKNVSGPFADEELNSLYQQQALLTQWEEPTNALLLSSDYEIGFTSVDADTSFWDSPTQSLLNNLTSKTENQ